MDDIKTFRAKYQLPAVFGVALFEPKEFNGLASIHHSKTQLNALRTTLIDAVPETLPVSELMRFTGNLSHLFRVKLYEVNDAIGLKPVEIDFAAAGFEDVCQAWLYAFMQARVEKNSRPSISRIYQEWLEGSVRISQTRYHYDHQGETWHIQIINNAYGRAGLVIETASQTFHVRDVSLACPAEGFMEQLLTAVLSKLQTVTK
jgi:hypothetical protein